MTPNLYLSPILLFNQSLIQILTHRYFQRWAMLTFQIIRIKCIRKESFQIHKIWTCFITLWKESKIFICLNIKIIQWESVQEDNLGQEMKFQKNYKLKIRKMLMISLSPRSTKGNLSNKVKLFFNLYMDQNKSLMDLFCNVLCSETRRCMKWYKNYEKRKKKKQIRN